MVFTIQKIGFGLEVTKVLKELVEEGRIMRSGG